MPKVKREVSEDSSCDKRRRGKAHKGGDPFTLISQHNLKSQGAIDPPSFYRERLSSSQGDGTTLSSLRLFMNDMISRVDLPHQSFLWRVDWNPPMVLWDACPNWSPADSAHEATSLKLYVQSYEQKQAMSLQPLTSTATIDPSNPSHLIHMIDAGGHIYDLDWAPCTNSSIQWLAVACGNKDAHTRVKYGCCGSIQLWSYDTNTSMKLVHTIKLDDGEPLQISWRPGAPAASTIGTLAASMDNGDIVILDVPKTEASCLYLSPRTTLRVPNSRCYSLAWGGNARLAAGCSKGQVIVWDLDESDSPMINVSVHDTLVCALSWQMLPPLDLLGTPNLSARPHILLSVGWDGSEHITDIYDVYSTTRYGHSREPRYATVWAPWNGAWIMDFGDNQFGTVSLRTHDIGRHHMLGIHHGRIISLAASAFHPYIASGSADGSVNITNALNVSKRKAMEEGGRLVHKRFRLIQNDANTYTIRHGFYPEGVLPRSQTQKSAPLSIDRWDPSVCITSVAWCPNDGHRLLLASGTGIGLVRVEWIEAPLSMNE